MDREEILLAVWQMGDALAYLHERQLFYTDVKARNILVRGLGPLDVVLADCGDVRRVVDAGQGQRHRRRHRRGADDDDRLRGTPSYYSPEMVRHKRHVGPGDDVWALGVTLLGMLAQWPALRRHDLEGLRAYPGQCAAHARALLALNRPGHGLVTLLARMLEADEAARAGARECADEARRLLRDERAHGNRGLGIEAPADFEPISFW